MTQDRETTMRRQWERDSPLRRGRLIGRTPEGWNIFDMNEREGWLNRSARALLSPLGWGRAKDIVRHTVTTRFDSPDLCFDGPTVGRRHQAVLNLPTGKIEDVMRCSKCGSITHIAWRDQPEPWRVLLGQGRPI